MTTRTAVPAHAPDLSYDDSDSANNRFKSSFRSYFWSAIIVAAGAHVGAFVYAPEFTAEDIRAEVAEIATIELPPEIDIPEAPQAISRPATPVIATADIADDVTIAPTTFETNPVDALPPPPGPKRGDAVVDEETPFFTPFTVAPDILNRREIVTAMARSYPPMLREAGIGGEVHVFFYIDETGRVKVTRLAESSGHPRLDAAALEVAGLYEFSPAINRDRKVAVWVSFPVMFAVAN